MKEVYYHLTEKFKILLNRFSLKIPLLLLHGKAITHSQNSGNTVWKLQNFSVTRILRDIGEFRVSKSAVSANLEAMNFVDYFSVFED